jgi:uncharacterized membrane-anchored protein YhcB (DUF1043 family)
MFPQIPTGLDDFVTVSLFVLVVVAPLIPKLWGSLSGKDKKFSNQINTLIADVDDIEKQLGRGDAHFDATDEKLAQAAEEYEEMKEEVSDIHLSILRSQLFAQTTSREHEEAQLEAGKLYLSKGGNGSGHIRYQQLCEDYQRRLNDDDWVY